MKSNKVTRYFFEFNQQTLIKKQKIVNETKQSILTGHWIYSL